MQELFTALKVKFDANQAAGSVYAAVGGRYYLFDAPQNATMPYIVLSHIGQTPLYTFTETLEQPKVQFTIISKSYAETEVCDIYKKLIALYDESTISPVDYSDVLVRRAFSILRKEDEPTTSGMRVYYYVVDYNIILQVN